MQSNKNRRNDRSAPRVLCGMAVLGALSLALSVPVAAQELIQNGGFETGTLTGWTTAQQTGSDGAFAIGDNTLDPTLLSPITPISGLASVGAKSGSFYAVSDGQGPGTRLLSQTFTLAPLSPAADVRLSFDMFVNDYAGFGALNRGGALDYTNPIPTQFGRVDLLSAGADPFTTSTGILQNLYNGEDSSANLPNDYTPYSFDITSLVKGGGTFTLRFAEVDNVFPINQGVDNVSVFVRGQSPAVPEAGTAALALPALLPLFALLRRRRAA